MEPRPGVTGPDVRMWAAENNKLEVRVVFGMPADWYHDVGRVVTRENRVWSGSLHMA